MADRSRQQSVPWDRLKLKKNTLARKTLSEGIFQVLRDAILAWELPPATPLTEAHLARTFGVSSTPIREALQKLVHHGLADRETAKGIRIHTLTKQEVKEYYELRLSLEPLALSQSGPKLRDADFERLEKLLEKAELAIRSSEIDRLFHLSRMFSSHLVSRADNRLLLEWLETLSDRQALVRHRLRSVGYRSETYWEERRDVLEAVRSGDIAKACGIMREYIEKAMVFVARHWETSENPEARFARDTERDGRSYAGPSLPPV